MVMGRGYRSVFLGGNQQSEQKELGSLGWAIAAIIGYEGLCIDVVNGGTSQRSSTCTEDPGFLGYGGGPKGSIESRRRRLPSAGWCRGQLRD